MNSFTFTVRHPRTVTRDLPHYVIGTEYKRLVRLAREHDHMYERHSFASRQMIREQCGKLHYRVYKQHCYYQ